MEFRREDAPRPCSRDYRDDGIYWTCTCWLRRRHEPPYQNCSAKSGSNLGLCVGYIVGVADTLEDTTCLTKGVSSRQVYDVVKQYLESHPEERHYPASAIVSDAIKKAFCH